MPPNPLLIEALNKSLENLRETIGRLHFLTVSEPDGQPWDEVRQMVSCLDSIADVMEKVLQAIGEDTGAVR